MNNVNNCCSLLKKITVSKNLENQKYKRMEILTNIRKNLMDNKNKIESFNVSIDIFEPNTLEIDNAIIELENIIVNDIQKISNSKKNKNTKDLLKMIRIKTNCCPNLLNKVNLFLIK